jgi:hypothetical protein
LLQFITPFGAEKEALLTNASDETMVTTVSKIVGNYARSLLSSRNEQDRYIASP